MWGTLSSFAAAAAEQVQQEAASIRADMEEVTKQGFDLLDKLDKTMDKDETEDDSEDGSGQEDRDPDEEQEEDGEQKPVGGLEDSPRAAPDPPVPSTAPVTVSESPPVKGDGGPDEDIGLDEEGDRPEQAPLRADVSPPTPVAASAPAAKPNVTPDLSVINAALGVAAGASVEDLAEAASTAVQEKAALSAAIRQLEGELSSLTAQHEEELVTLQQQCQSEGARGEEMRAEVGSLQQAAELARGQVEELLAAAQRRDGELESLTEQLRGAEARAEKAKEDAAAVAESGRAEIARLREECTAEREQLTADRASAEESLRTLQTQLAEAEMASARAADDAAARENDIHLQLKEECDRLTEELAAVREVALSAAAQDQGVPRDEFESAIRDKQREIEDALAKVDELTAESISQNEKMEDLSMQLVAAERQQTGAKGSKKAIKEATKRADALAAELEEAQVALQVKEGEIDKLRHECQSQKAKIVVLKEHEKSLLKKHSDELSAVTERNKMAFHEASSLREEISSLLLEKNDREEGYAETVRSLDTALAQIHELSIAAHPGGHESNDLLVGSTVGSIPSTPVSAGTPAGDDSFLSPDEGSFKTPGMGPRTAGVARSKKSTKPKSKTEMAKEIHGLNKQLQDLRSLQGSMTSQFKQSMEEMNEEMANSVLTAAAMAAASPTKGAKKPVEDTEHCVDAVPIDTGGAGALTSEERAKLQDRIEQLTAELGQSSDETEILKQQIIEITEAKNAAEKRFSSLEEEVSTVARDMDGKLAVISILEGVKLNLEEEVKAVREQLRAAEENASAELGELHKSNESMQAELDQKTVDIENAVASERDAVAVLRQQLTSAEQETSRLTEELETATSVSSALRESVDRLNSDVEESRAASLVLENELAAAREQLQADLSVVSQLKGHISELENRKTALEQQVADIAESRGRGAEERVAALEGVVSAGRAREEVLTTQVNELSVQLSSQRDASDAEIDGLRSSIANLENELSSLRSEAAVAAENTEKLQENIVAMERECSELSHLRDVTQQAAYEKSTLEESLQALKEQKSHDEHRATEAEVRLAKCTEELARVKEEMAASQASLSKIKAESADAEASWSARSLTLTDEISELKSECARLDAELTRRVVDDASMRETNRHLDTLKAALEEQVSSLSEQLVAAATAHNTEITSVTIELDDAKSAESLSQEVISSQKQSLIALKQQIADYEGELVSMKSRLESTENSAQDAIILSQELATAKQKLSKIEEKKKREFENLKKQNELISRLQREKEGLERAHEQEKSTLKDQLEESQREVDNAQRALAEKEESHLDLEEKYNFLLENVNDEATRTAEAPSDQRTDEAAEGQPSCPKCAEVIAGVEAKAAEHAAELEVLSHNVEVLEAEKQEIKKEIEEMIEARADWIVKLSAAEKELTRLRMCEKSLASKAEETQYLEQELTKLRALGKEKDLLIAEKENALFSVKDELRTLQYQAQKESTASATPKTPPLPEPADIESGAGPLGTSARSSAKKHAAPQRSPDGGEDDKGKDDLAGVSPWVLAMWNRLRPCIPSSFGSKPPTRKFIASAQQVYFVLVHIAIILCFYFIESVCERGQTQ